MIQRFAQSKTHYLIGLAATKHGLSKHRKKKLSALVECRLL